MAKVYCIPHLFVNFFIEPTYSEARSPLTSVPSTLFSIWGTTPVSEPVCRASPYLVPSVPPTSKVFSFKLLGPGPKEGLLRGP